MDQTAENHPRVADIAADHRVLAGLIDALGQAIIAHASDPTRCGTLLRDIESLSIASFHREDAIMRDNQYPDAASHHAEHQDLTIGLHEFTTAVAAGQIHANVETAGQLRDWLTDHIDRQDRKFLFWLETRNSDG